MVPVYKAEIEAGIADKVKSEASIAYLSQAKNSELSQDLKDEINEQVTKGSKDGDLFYLDAILVSVGWNKNDDVFHPKETWLARSTPVDKQFNFMHNEHDIIGHMKKSWAVNSKGEVLDDDLPLDNIPNKFDIVTSSVIYNSWTETDLIQRTKEIIHGISLGKWFVSMECLFKDFDYALINPKGEHKIIARNQDSAFLTKHLRAYGGEGEFQGNRIGRLLKNFAFSGKGLVENPANPRSIIFKNSNPFYGISSTFQEFKREIESIKTSSENKVMSENTEQTVALTKEVEKLKDELRNVRAERDSVQDKLKSIDEEAHAEEVKSLKDEVESLKSQVQERDETIASHETTIDEKDKEIKEKAEKVEELEKSLNEVKVEVKNAHRFADLTSAGVEDEKAKQIIEKFSEASDDMFKEVVELSKVESVTDEDDDDKNKKRSKMKKSESEVDYNEDNATASVEETEEDDSASLSTGSDDDSLEDTRQKLCAWVASNMKTVKSDK